MVERAPTSEESRCGRGDLRAPLPSDRTPAGRMLGPESKSEDPFRSQNYVTTTTTKTTNININIRLHN